MNRKKFSDFVRYDNTLPLLLIVVFVGASSSFALTDPGVQNALLKPVSTVVSVDNTYIASVDLSNYSPKVTISNVLEDADSYIVTYNFETIELIDSVWKPTTISRSLKVDKNVLGQYKDLGIFVTEELKQVIDQEKSRLLATQEIEKKNISQKTVATEYTGLIGKLLDADTETLPGYVPVVTETPEVNIVMTPVKETPATPVDNSPVIANVDQTGQTDEGTVENATTTEPTNVNVQIVGNSPEQILVGATYTDMGVFVNNATLESVSIKVNGTEADAVVIDTTNVANYTISYTVTTDKGVFNLERLVVVSAPVETVPEPVIEVPAEVPTQPTETVPEAAPSETVAQ